MLTNSSCSFSVDSGMNGFFSRLLFLWGFLFVSPVDFLFNSLNVNYFVLLQLWNKRSVQKLSSADSKWEQKVFTGITKVEVCRAVRIGGQNGPWSQLTSRLSTPGRGAVGGSFLRSSSDCFVLC